MEEVFVTAVEIQEVRHLKDILIPLSTQCRKHLILTGKNGSGKTSVLEALEAYFRNLFHMSSRDDKADDFYWSIKREEPVVRVRWSSVPRAVEAQQNHQFVTAYYPADRLAEVPPSSEIEHLKLKEHYDTYENPGRLLGQYMLNLKTTQAFAQQKQNWKRSEEIDAWFDRFEQILREIFEDPALKLDFDIETFAFTILQSGHVPFAFHQLSSGYAAIFAIVNDLMMRMEAQKNYNLEGVVLIDEIDAHLHLELQKKILPILTGLFPKIQWIVTTHSPFILSSLENSVVFDLETQTLAEQGLAKLPYEGIVEGYFGASRMSENLEETFRHYQELTDQDTLTDEDWAELARLECCLDEVPDFLAPELAEEYSRRKLEFSLRHARGEGT